MLEKTCKVREVYVEPEIIVEFELETRCGSGCKFGEDILDLDGDWCD